MKSQLLATVGAAAFIGLLGAPEASANTIVGSIYGVYDAQCGSNFDCTFGRTGYGSATNGGQEYDTPRLFIINDGTHAFTNLSITLTGYQARNNGDTTTFSLPDVPGHSIYDLRWEGAMAPHQLFSYDYDDEWGNADPGQPGCNLSFAICAFVGNFDVHIGGMLNGNAIASSFSPDNTQDGGNAAHAFVGWEGLNADGLSETSQYDTHSTSTVGVLAHIFTGTTGNQHNVPEPATMTLLGSGLAALALTRRRRKK